MTDLSVTPGCSHPTGSAAPSRWNQPRRRDLALAALGQAASRSHSPIVGQGALFLLGGALGLVLYHALFGFTSAWRVFIATSAPACAPRC